ncbi:acetylornithine transaminase [Pseudolysinimonas sp.]|jgi:acetylornithine/N-succinyldiaminopimelate aminotransferase|uniref:acetylornithine transaminase n=1 Tax=Pseudolysinimonas sp. TaxID=2680009 RepID=UPI0037849D5E
MSGQQRFRDAMFSYAPTPLRVLVRGEGARVWDDQGTEYLDFLAGIAVNALGHAHPVFVEAVSRQAGRIAHVSNYFASEPQLELAERLKRLTGGDAVFFGNSGTEVIEAAIKVSRRTGRTRILTLEKSFHGRSTGALAITGKDSYRTPFEPLIPGPEFLPSTVEALENAIGPDVAALVLEPIKGEAGALDLPEGYLAAARALTAKHGALLILDEIQTGAGRTGDWFAFQRDGIVPDLLALAKGIGGGFPIGALVAFGPVKDLLQPGDHGTTFGGNPLATATANAVLGEIERADLVGNARAMGELIRAGLAALDHPAITDVSGRGLLVGIGLDGPHAGAVATRALELGLIVNAAAEDRIRLAPPLTITAADVDRFFDLFPQALAATESSDS